jgi:hypothetical protein
MKLGDLMTALVEWEVNEEDGFTTPAFVIDCSDEELERARDFIERAKMHIEDVINYRHDMEEYHDVTS